MRKPYVLGVVVAVFVIAALAASFFVFKPTVRADNNTQAQSPYIVLGWNTLGMHCLDPNYSEICILPPFNTLMVQVLRRGSPVSIVTSGITLEYSIEHNTTVVGKTDFWQYSKQLFGVDLPVGIGLTGNGLKGTLKLNGDHFEATGIPLLPRDDKMNWNPYQVADVRLKNKAGKVLQTVRIVLPVSDELNCAKCHAADADASMKYGINTGTLEGNILAIHDKISGTTLAQSKPVLCAGCHASNALGKPGNGVQKSLSEAMHGKHARIAGDVPGCYDCHPGAKTKCLRTAINGMGFQGTDPSCPSCHGDLATVASTITAGRRPWLDEPTCEKCHGDSHSVSGGLYRETRDQTGVFCPACHNSPHAWWPTKQPLDNVQPLTYQLDPTAIGACPICHSKPMRGVSPHSRYIDPAWRL
jgi:hypothetical protein